MTNDNKNFWIVILIVVAGLALLGLWTKDDPPATDVGDPTQGECDPAQWECWD